MSHERRRATLPFLAESGGIIECDQVPAQKVAAATRRAGLQVRSPNPQHRAALSPPAVDLVAERFRILGEPLRVRIIQELRNGERSVSELVEALGTSQPNVSKHLRIIQSAGIAGRRHDGNLVYYFITDQSVFDLCDAVCANIGEELSGDVALAAELQDGRTRGR